MDCKQIMGSLIDKLCDHFQNDKVKVLIDNGFDQWQIIKLMKGQQLVQLQFSSEQAIVIMVSINATAKQFGMQQVFDQKQIQNIIQLTKDAENQRIKQLENYKEDQPSKMLDKKLEQKDTNLDIKQYPRKEITEALIWKGTTHKNSKDIKISSINMISLEEKAITHITQLDKVTALQVLHLAHNYIYKIQNMESLNKLKTLKLQYNQISTIQGLQTLVLLEKLTLNDNFISQVKGLTNNKRLHYFNISNQKIHKNMHFQQHTLYSLAYCLQKLECNNNQVKDISNFKHLKVIKEISLKNNKLQEVGQLSEALGCMEMLKIIDFRGNPINKVPKYRDYVVILSKVLEQLDTKKILPTQRQYLVKLYSLKHINQMKVNEQKQKPKENINKNFDLQGQKMNEDHEGVRQFHHGQDLRGNAPYQITKTNKNSK